MNLVRSVDGLFAFWPGAVLWPALYAVTLAVEGIWGVVVAPLVLVLVVGSHHMGQALWARATGRPVHTAHVTFFGGHITPTRASFVMGGPLAVGVVAVVGGLSGSGLAANELLKVGCAFAGLSVLPIHPLAGGVWWAAFLEKRTVRRRLTWMALLGTMIPVVCGATALIGGGYFGAAFCFALALRNGREVWRRRRVLFGGRWARDEDA